MFKNYIKIAFRKLWKNKGLSFINIFGLATGMACSLMIFQYVQDELSYDRHHAQAERIYRVVKDFINDDGSRIPDATTPGPLAGAMQQEIPEVETITRINPAWGNVVPFEYQGERISEPRVWRVDSSFFDVFTIPFIAGDAQTALADINSVVLTESTAKRYFGNDDPIGKILRLDGRDDVTVTAVIADVPAQSHFHYDFLLSYRRLPQNAHTNWGSYNYYTYVKLKPGTNIPSLEKKIQDVHDRNTSEHYSAFYVQPLLDIHLTSKLKWELEPNGDRLYVYMFMIIGMFILLIAAINYVNLATARSALRARETGIRKVSGAARTSLIVQFLLESVLICSLAALFALAIAWLITPTVNNLTQKQLYTFDPYALGLLAAVTLGIGMVAGLFPALYLSSFKPVSVLKGFKLGESGALNLRKSLVVVQFTISITLITSTLIVMRQIDYLQSANLGFDKDQVVVLTNGRGLSKAERSSFLNSIRELAGVAKAATSGNILGRGFSTSRLRAVGSELEQQLNFTTAGFDFLDVVGIEMKEGRGFTQEFPGDTLNNGTLGGPLQQRLGGIVINERAAREFGLGSPAVGKRLEWATDGDTLYYVEVIGVTKDFHFTSLRNEIKPYGFLMSQQRQTNYTIKLSGGDIKPTMAQLETLWKKNFPERTFDYTFMNEAFDTMYVAEARFQKVFISLVALGIIIACLGLFALAAFSAEQRIREIGIRKVLGASVVQVVTLLSKDFLRLVAISIILSVPVAAYAMNNWLQGFAYHITMEWWIFLAAGVIALVIAVLTISSQAFRAAVVNPAKSLRSE